MGHKKRFDGLLAEATRKGYRGFIQVQTVDTPTTTHADFSGPATTSVTTPQQMENYKLAIADGTYNGL